MADLAAAGVGRSLVIGDDPGRITAQLAALEIEPSDLLEVLDPTVVDAGLAETLRRPESIGDLAAPWREGARAAAQATGKVSQAVLAAGTGRYELAAGVRIQLDDVQGPDWSATRMVVTTGAVRLTVGPAPSIRSAGIDVVATVGADDVTRRLQHLPVASIRIDEGSVLVRPSGRLTPFTIGVVPGLHAGRVVLEGHTIAWRGVKLPLPSRVARRWTRWIDPPEWLEMDGLRVDADTVEIRGHIEHWAQPISVGTIQRLAAAARRRGQDLVVPGWSAPSG